uniref:Variant surface glycoprotein 1125.2946 n=1 Tax=Trypanosoma brucei TaxID=5691 RepID=A0A1J0R958_9TRYP|nr:variant surface glycoprotein 1125.2946 [Trypanosoma brucei]
MPQQAGASTMTSGLHLRDNWQKTKRKESAKAPRAFRNTQKKNLKDLAEQAFAYTTNPAITEPQTKKAAFAAEAERYIYGGPASTTEAGTGHSGDRNAECGAAAGNKGSLAGQTLRNDFLCVCAKSAEGASKPKSYYSDCQPAADPTWNTADNGQTIFAHLTGQCKQYPQQPKATPSAITTAVQALLTKISKPQGTGGDKFFVLGNLEGNGSGGCCGQSSANGGMCVSYKDSASKKADIAWISSANAAAAELKTLEAANQQAEKFLVKTEHLNTTAYEAV